MNHRTWYSIAIAEFIDQGGVAVALPWIQRIEALAQPGAAVADLYGVDVHPSRVQFFEQCGCDAALIQKQEPVGRCLRVCGGWWKGSHPRRDVEPVGHIRTTVGRNCERLHR